MSSFCLWRWGSSFLPGDLPASAIFKHVQLKIFTIQGAIFWGSTFWTPSPGSSILVCADPDVWPPPNLPLSPLNKRPHQPQGQKPRDQLWSLIATLHPMCQSLELACRSFKIQPLLPTWCKPPLSLWICTARRGLEPSQKPDLNSRGGTRTYCLLIEIVHLVSGG